MSCRKHGHNETDQPSFTQPRMYEVIKNKKPPLDIYIEQLLQEGTLTKEDVEEHKKWYFPYAIPPHRLTL